jgi:hypothetical protein
VRIGVGMPERERYVRYKEAEPPRGPPPFELPEVLPETDGPGAAAVLVGLSGKDMADSGVVAGRS